MLNINQLTLLLDISLGRASVWVDALNAAMALHDITTPQRQAAFLAQLCHESNHLGTLSESFNYTPDALMKTFNTPSRIRFTPELAYRYGRTPGHPADQKMIASIAYANRMGNGGIESGDGWAHRGRGPLQITGKNNYRACGKAIGIDLLDRPELLEKPDTGAMAAAWFWVEGNQQKNLNLLADAGDIVGISKIINGGTNGLAHRIALNDSMIKVLA